MKRNIPILIVILIFTVIISVLFFLDDQNFNRSSDVSWVYKNIEKKSRKLSIPVILYHNIDGNGAFSIDLEVLKEQFKIIKDNNIRVIPLSDLVEKLETHSIYDENVMAISFDDCYFSMYTKLLPLAIEFNYPITLFVYTNLIYSKANKSLTWDRLAEMESKGIDIQCHTISHTDLTKLSEKKDYKSKKRLFDEMYLSKRILELYLDKKITLFAFPYGRYDLHLIQLAYYAGYNRVFSTDYGSNIVTRDNFCLRRQHIKKDYSLEKFLEKIR